MSRESWALVVNPKAGWKKAKRRADRLARAIEASGDAVEVSMTRSQGDGETRATDAVKAGATRVVACGGDGTVHEVVNGVMSSADRAGDVAVGILPSGRCNDLNYALGLPTNPGRAIESMVGSPVRRMDLGRIGDRYFTTIATLGFDSEVSEYVNDGRAPGFLRGSPAYLYGAVVQLIKYRSPSVRLKGDFGEFEGPVFLVATGNTSRYGGRMSIAPSAILDDGMLDVCLVEPVRRLEVLRMIPKTFKGAHVGHRAVTVHRTSRLEIDSDEPLSLWADGERLSQTPATIEVVPRSLSVLAPIRDGEMK